MWIRSGGGRQGQKVGRPATATHRLPDQNMGLAIIARGRESKVAPDDSLNFLVQPQVLNGKGSWYVLGVWDQEDSDNLIVNVANAEGRTRYGTVAPTLSAPRTFDSFINLVNQAAQRITRPASVQILSRNAVAQSTPSHTHTPA